MPEELKAVAEPTKAANGQALDHEAILVTAAQKGDRAAFGELVDRYERRVFRLALNIAHNREDAEEIVQDSFVKAFLHLNEFHGGSRFSTWLTRIAINEALMKLRRRRTNLLSLDEEVETEDHSIPREIADWGPTPEQRYSQLELREILAEAVGHLSPAYRIVFQLRDIEQFSTEETAQILGISSAAVKSRAMRARLAVRERLNRYFRQSGGGRLEKEQSSRVISVYHPALDGNAMDSARKVSAPGRALS